jgi:predicted nucleotidyltransferase
MSSYAVKHPIVTHYAGSLAYGTNLPDSDVDIRGIFCATPEEVLTPFQAIREVTMEGCEDGKLYELSNFMKLYLDCNPNIVESLWIDKSDILTDSEAYWHLREHNSALLSSKVAFTFSGYAVSQLKRIKGHNKWLNNPQSMVPPQHGSFLKLVQNFTDEKIMPRDFKLEMLKGLKVIHYGSCIFGVVRDSGVDALANDDFNISAKQVSHNGSSEQPLYIIKYLQDEYREAKEKHSNYWTWKMTRNEKRSATEEKYGYDTKHAMHLVRLLRMGEEILTGAGVIVKRPDAAELLEIRNGAWDYDDLVEYAESKDELIRGELYKNTELRKKPDIKLATKVLMQCQEMCWER